MPLANVKSNANASIIPSEFNILNIFFIELIVSLSEYIESLSNVVSTLSHDKFKKDFNCNSCSADIPLDSNSGIKSSHVYLSSLSIDEQIVNTLEESIPIPRSTSTNIFLLFIFILYVPRPTNLSKILTIRSKISMSFIPDPISSPIISKSHW
ncbi:putative orfan [Tupanvirus soda lake]|uniref:Orfan n=2 Tax=Tupanvirus TaxID=2094720 RepID=A0AC62AC09_9VIRU|nr:putative orfan [Tupanvirus soda lake]QKU35175.1 putative orfan [Tupanvirus soda lake]